MSESKILNKEDEELIVEYFYRGYSANKTSIEMKIGKNLVQKVLRDNNLSKTKYREDRNKQIIKKYENGTSLEELSKTFNLTEAFILTIINRDGVVKKPTVVTEEMKLYCIENYNKDTSSNIATKLGISRSAVLKVWIENDLNGKDIGRSYYCDFDYFEKLDSPEKAYWLGFIMADGCIYKRKGHQGLIQIFLQDRDRKHLENFNDSLNGNYPIQSVTVNNREYTQISITSDKMFNDLIDLGVKEKKTWLHCIDENNIPKKYWLDYCFGFFDGDGSIGKPQSFNSQVGVSFVGNFSNMSTIQYILSKFGIFTSLIREKRDKYTYDFYTLILTDMTSKYQFLKLYCASSYSTLNRKYLRASDFIKRVEENTSNRSENIRAVKTYNENTLINFI